MNFIRRNNRSGNKSGILTALIFIFVNVMVAQTSYPITDPRNPNCPCHKYQKLADDEFKNLLAQNNVVNKEKGISNDDMGSLNKNINPIQQLNDDNTVGNLSHNFNPINPPKFGGISSDELNRINLSKGDNVLGVINDEPRDIIVSEQKMGRSWSFSRSTLHKTSKHWKGKHKKHTAFHKQLKRIFYVGGWDIWKRKRIIAACYHWK